MELSNVQHKRVDFVKELMIYMNVILYHCTWTRHKYKHIQSNIFKRVCYEGKRLTLSLIRQFCSRRLWTYFVTKIEYLYNFMDNLWLKVENIVSKGDIARIEQFLLLSLCFQKAVCCRGVRKRLYEGKG